MSLEQCLRKLVKVLGTYQLDESLESLLQESRAKIRERDELRRARAYNPKAPDEFVTLILADKGQLTERAAAEKYGVSHTFVGNIWRQHKSVANQK